MKHMYDIDIDEYKNSNQDSIKLQAPKQDFLRSV